ncbi:hypothetical protein RclHR1_09110003 [Rhizophagus clarus]|uniref:S-adenosyl-L-methionine-dependent methyltransferase n=1 Tax=Rhizophagus clarus TaxID=94130 RepID=A0A2Z6S3G5_9GLOM|nr:hypothetical protein RclHR1_09110003 [Rhizophagus clarus]GES97751.1 S-adenosyl-L-methionine-dependent methyltransferase [Rhizophagus clarus]
MGNVSSYSKHKRSIKKIPKFSQTESEHESQEKLLDFYLSTGTDSIDRTHMYHFIRACLFQSNFSSPIEDKLIEGGCKVLDIGCGAGTWLLDLSNRYENSNFFGIDIKPVFPQEIKPKNLEFIEADVTNGLAFHDNEFDFTHVENMSFVFTPDQWDLVLSELVRVTKPGGYIEVGGRRNSYVGDGPIFRKISSAPFTSCSKRNIDIKLIYNLDSRFGLLPNIGKVHRIEKDLIIGPNGDKIGIVFQDLALAYYTSEMAIKSLSEEIGISEEEYKSMVGKKLIDELKQTKVEVVHVRFWTQKQLS